MRTVMEVVSDIRRHCQTVELSILVDELVLLVAKIQADSDAIERQRETWRDKKRSLRMSRDKKKGPHTPKEKLNPPDNPSGYLAPQQVFEADFAAFWQIFPRKIGRGAALKAYRNALKRAIPEDILAGAKRYAALKTDPEYTKHPATWLNADCWLDESNVVKFEPSAPKRTWAEIKAERDKV